MNVKRTYIRVSTTIYNRVQKPLLSKKDEQMLITWRLETIKQDHPNNWKETALPSYNLWNIFLVTNTSWDWVICSCWSIRNKYRKGCSAQGYSYYSKGSKIHESLSVFEGIFDLLSHAEMDHLATRSEGFLVLNSLSNRSKAQAIHEQYQTVSLFLDHDPAGRKSTNQILILLPQAKDASGFYKSCKDLNEFLVKSTNGKKSVGIKACRWSEASHVLVRPKRLLR